MVRGTLSINGQKALLLRMPREEAIAQNILWKLDQVVPSSTLVDAVAWWELDEPEGVRLDATGRGNDLNTLGGSPGFVLGADAESPAASFDGTQYLMRTLTPSDDLACGPTDFTIAGWVLVNNFSNNRVFLAWTPAALSTDILRLHTITTTGQVRTAVNPLTSPLASVVGTWYFVVLDYLARATTRTLTVQGADGVVYSATDTANAVDTSTAAYFSIGFSALGTAAYHQGAVQRVGKWNRLLTDSEKQELFNHGRGIRWPGRRIRVLRG